MMAPLLRRGHTVFAISHVSQPEATVMEIIEDMALLPVAVRNKVVGGEFVLTTSQFRPNFYIENGEAATGMYQPLAFGGGNAEHERSDATMLAENELGRQLNPSEVSSFWFWRSIREIREDPARWQLHHSQCRN